MNIPRWQYTYNEEDSRLEHAQAEIEALRKEVDTLEQLRPHWAQGYTSDSEAAQSATAALSQLWGLIGAKHQTEAVQRLEKIIVVSGRNIYRMRLVLRAARTYVKSCTNPSTLPAIEHEMLRKIDEVLTAVDHTTRDKP